MSRLEVGDILENRYRVDRPIARGGMSTVYRCVDLRLGRAVAAKVMHDRYVDDPVFIHRFEREARAMAQLTHPNLVGVHDFSADGEPIFLIMELITGGTLRELVAERGPMPPHAAAAVMRAMLTGLAVVHDKGLVHRDIKPDNVLINGDQRVKLGDFGLVRATNAATATSNSIVGTVSYLSPEQVDGSDITPASDVYSAGIVLFELLTGTVPFSGDSDLTHAMARLEADVPAPSSRIQGVPPLFDALVASATDRDPEVRFADATEFLDALDDVARELALPDFVVPVPKNSAAARTAAQPTDMSGIGATGIFEPTSVIAAAGDAVDLEDKPEFEGNEDRTVNIEPTPETPVEPPRREPLSFETRVEPINEPSHHTPPSAPVSAVTPPVSPPMGAPAPAPVPTPAPMQHQHSPAQREPHYPATAEDEPAPRVISNRSTASLLGWLALVVLATAAVALGGWWFGSGLYGYFPTL